MPSISLFLKTPLSINLDTETTFPGVNSIVFMSFCLGRTDGVNGVAGASSSGWLFRSRECIIPEITLIKYNLNKCSLLVIK